MTKDNDNNDNKNKLLALLLTLLLGGGIVATLLVTSLNYEYPPKDALLQQLQDPIEFGAEDEEFVEFEEMLANAADESAEPGEPIEQEQPTEDNPPQETGQNEMENQGTVNEPPQPPVATKNESPMQVPEQPKKDTKPQKETTTPTVTPKPKSLGENKPQTPPTTSQKSEAQKKAEEQMKNAFRNGKNGNNGTAQRGEGVVSVKANGQLGNIPGYFQGGKCPGPGTVIVKVQIDPTTGKISNPQVVGGTLKDDKEACKRCIGYALKSHFAVSSSKVLPPSGTITYTVP